MALKHIQRLFTHFINYRTGTEHGKYRFHWNEEKPGELYRYANAFMSQTNLGFLQIVEIFEQKVLLVFFLFKFNNLHDRIDLKENPMLLKFV